MPDRLDPDMVNRAGVLWRTASDVVSTAYSLRPLTYSDAMDMTVCVLNGPTRPGEEHELAAMILRKEYLTRYNAGGQLMLTSHPICGLTPITTEFCLRVQSLGARTLQGISMEASEYVEISTLLALCGTARSIALLSSVVELASQGNYASVGVLYRSIVELWIHVIYLLRHDMEAVELLVSTHRWHYRDLADDPYLEMLGVDVGRVTPQRPNIRSVVERLETVSEQQLGFAEGRKGMMDETYAGVFRPASHLYAHTSLVGLLNHTELFDGHYVRPSLIERAIGSENQWERVLVSTFCVADMLLQVTQLLRGNKTTTTNEEFQELLSAFKRFMGDVIRDVAKGTQYQ